MDYAPDPDESKGSVSSYSWTVLDAQIMSSIFSSIESHIVTNLRPHCTAQAMWAYLKRVYHQDNDAHHFQLKNAIVMFQHENRSIQDNYSVFLTF